MEFHIYEVSPRDGLQGLEQTISTATKLSLIDKLVKAGIDKIEVGSFVHPALVPNMADSDEVYAKVSQKYSNCELSVLIPNKRGVKRAKAVGATNFNIFMSPSEGFNNNNHNDTTQGVYRKYQDALQGIPKNNIRVYLSCVFGCPIDGEIGEERLIQALEWADQLGNTIVLSDTAGKATSRGIESVISLSRDIGITARIALHLHYGDDVEIMCDKLNIAYDMGVREFDSSITGLGGCPFVSGSGGNLATEELVEWAEKRGLRSGIDPKGLQDAINFANASIGKSKEALQITAQ